MIDDNNSRQVPRLVLTETIRGAEAPAMTAGSRLRERIVLHFTLMQSR